MKPTLRPFQHIRYEYEQRHIYHLPHKVFSRLESEKPAYILGTRGTGKTTLLKALEWKERISNQSLKRQLGDNVFENKYIGGYLKLPHFQLNGLEQTFPNLYPNSYPVLIGLYIDLISLQPLCIALSELSAIGVLQFSPNEERQALETLLNQFEFLKDTADSEPATLRSLKQALFRIQRKLEHSALYTKPISDVLQCGVTSIGELGRAFGDTFSLLCNNIEASEKWHFKICLDEAESLGNIGRKVLNTIVRTSKTPLVHVAAFVGVPDALVETFHPNLTLAEEDRQLIHLDEISIDDFRSLAEGVATARIQEATGDSSKTVVLKNILGSLDLNALCIATLRDSVNPEARALLAASNTENDLITTFLLQELKREAPSEASHRWEKRRQDSAFRRKAMVAAYLGMCHKYNVQPRYAYAEMIFQLSDYCIRDFLRFLNEIYIEANTTPESFVLLQLSIRQQDTAIKRASKAKVDTLNESGVHEPIPTYRLIDGLSKITSALQSSGKDNSNYRSPERGVFHFDIPANPNEDSLRLLSLIRDAAEVGFLMLKERGPKTWSFHIHASLAPYYGFSYRGAYYKTAVQINDLLLLAKSKDQNDFDASVTELTRKYIVGSPDETPLFDIIQDEN